MVIGSILLGAFACKVLDVNADIWWYVILALSVWLMYMADHILDAWRGKTTSTIVRHKFHYTHRYTIIPVWIIVALSSVFLSLIMLENEIIFLGLALGLCIMIYFGVIYFNKESRPYFLQKELFIAIVYIIGIWLAPVVWHSGLPNSIIMIIIVNFVLLGWAEGIIVSWFELEEDTANNHVSFTVLFGKKNTWKFTIFLLLIILFVSLTGLIIATTLIIRTAFVIELLMALSLALIVSFPAKFEQHQLYRYMGESTFLLPGLILFV